MTNLTILDFQNQRVLTTEQLAMVYETDEVRIRQGFSRNEDKFVSGTHYYKLTGAELKEFKAKYLKDTNLKFASELMLWTERGANRHCKILDTDKAWEQFDNLEETYFNVKQNAIDTSQLSPELQMFSQIFNSLAKNDLEQKRLSQAVEETKQQVHNISEIVALNTIDWRKETTEIINKIARKTGGHKQYQEIRNESYKLLDERAKSDIKQRLTNKQRKMALEGVAKSKIDKVSRLDVIEEDKRLLEIYLAVVKEIAIKYQVQINSAS
ncbi:hypothetical protein CN692_07725 [Bacillus sp. AFS002410]|uniref:ORF6N domain-containing protein n=1 Tax=Bacillus sp. AFS002410 TaxID=2033481 RepID=UPI000BF14CBC|nr:ORF6N domain-containing protein [Bacillus sp. AFS002410]PEJ58166.1 hypothetical protein CN692_07725 [Bacillus sp. AFS002410]